MLIESIFLAVFVLSLGGVILILIRKIPTLHTLPKNGTTGFKNHKYVLHLDEKIGKILIHFRKQILLHKFLSWVRVMTLKVEAMIDKSLHAIRKKAQKVDKDLKDKK